MRKANNCLGKNNCKSTRVPKAPVNLINYDQDVLGVSTGNSVATRPESNTAHFHPHPEDMERFALRKLETEKVEMIALHVAFCEECRSKLIEASDYACKLQLLLKGSGTNGSDVGA
jgi:hypothetical protein